jgi:hypothetical protein
MTARRSGPSRYADACATFLAPCAKKPGADARAFRFSNSGARVPGPGVVTAVAPMAATSPKLPALLLQSSGVP